MGAQKICCSRQQLVLSSKKRARIRLPAAVAVLYQAFGNYVMKQSKPIHACNFIYCWNHSNIFIISMSLCLSPSLSLSMSLLLSVSMLTIAAFRFLLFCFWCSSTLLLRFFSCCRSEWKHSRVSCCICCANATAVYRYLITKIETQRISRRRRLMVHSADVYTSAFKWYFGPLPMLFFVVVTWAQIVCISG